MQLCQLCLVSENTKSLKYQIVITESTKYLNSTMTIEFLVSLLRSCNDQAMTFLITKNVKRKLIIIVCM